MSFRRLAWCCALVAGMGDGSARGQEWTRFRGPDGTGIGRADGIPAAIAEPDYTWKVKLPGRGHSSPVLWGTKIFLSCEGPGATVRQVVCLDASDGKLLWSWRDRFTRYRSNRLNSFAASTPAVDAERVYLTWASGGKSLALALDHSGRKLWQYAMGPFDARHGAGASPIVIDGTVIVPNDNASARSVVVGLDAATGKLRWKIDRKSGPASYITPAIYRPPDAEPQVIFASCAEGVTSVVPASGKVNWHVPCGFKMKTVASPVMAGGLIFVSTGVGGTSRESAVVKPGSADSKAEVSYRLGREVPYVPTPIALGEHVFVLHDRGTLTCIEPKTGKKVWQERFSGVHFSSPVCVGKKIYLTNTKGRMSVVQAGPEYKLLATNTLPEGTHATPAVANGCMYIRTFNHLICVRGR